MSPTAPWWNQRRRRLREKTAVIVGVLTPQVLTDLLARVPNKATDVLVEATAHEIARRLIDAEDMRAGLKRPIRVNLGGPVCPSCGADWPCADWRAGSDEHFPRTQAAAR